MHGLPISLGVSTMPNLTNRIVMGSTSVNVGWVEGITMHSGGTVIVDHFALNRELTQTGRIKNIC